MSVRSSFHSLVTRTIGLIVLFLYSRGLGGLFRTVSTFIGDINYKIDNAHVSRDEINY